MNPCMGMLNISFFLLLQLTNETYVNAVTTLSQILKITESITNEQTDEVLGSVANYLDDVADFVNISQVVIDTAVSDHADTEQSAIDG